jgi:archaellum component FlaC
MTDEFTNNVAQKFPNTQVKETLERPWDVTESKVVTSIKRQEDVKKEELTDRIHHLYSELRSSLTVRSALEYDLKRAQRILEEVNRVKAEVEKIVEMLKVMEDYMKERVK